MRCLALVFSWLALCQCTTVPIQTAALTQVTQPIEAGRHKSSSTVIDKSGYAFDPADRSCDGFPRLQVATIDGTCLGMVMPQAKALQSGPWKMPRTIQQIKGTGDFLVIDMGGWAENRGAIYFMHRRSDGLFDITLVKSGLNMPHALKWGPGGFFYLGETDKVWRFHFVDGKIRDWEQVIAKLPRYKGYMHPLVALAFDPRNNDMYINSGAPSDHCFVKNHGEDYSDCPEDTEAGLAVIFRVPGEQLNAIPPGGIKTYEVAAHGLRNSMAMEITAAGLLVQGENGRDFPQLEEPFEELNVVDLADGQRGRHYGWPYCYDFHAVSPEWKFSQNLGDPMHKRFTAPVNCSAKTADKAGAYQAPFILMPPHAAPLHLGYYNSDGQLAELLKGKLLVTWHGYQPTGHRLVAYNVDSRGLPLLSTAITGKETYSFDVKGACPTQKAFKPEGGVDRFAGYSEVISQWDEIKETRPKGAPVAFTIADDGSIYIVEDKNRTVVRLAKSDRKLANNCSGGSNTADPRIELLAWRNFVDANPPVKAGYEALRETIFKKACASCHGGFIVNDIAADGYSQLDFLVKNEFFVAHDSAASKLRQVLAASGEVPAMPPADVNFTEEERAAAVQLAGDWINALPQGGIATAMKKTAMKDTRKLRAQASASSTECGQLNAGDVIYIDPRPETQLRKDGWVWSKIYMVPGDSRLFKGACTFPVDGVFYSATVKQ